MTLERLWAGWRQPYLVERAPGRCHLLQHLLAFGIVLDQLLDAANLPLDTRQALEQFGFMFGLWGLHDG